MNVIKIPAKPQKGNNAAKQEVKKRSGIDRFAKPRNNDGIYALVMDSNKFFL